MSRAETNNAARAYAAKHGGTLRHALKMVMALRAADAWNARYPVGTSCTVQSVTDGPKTETKTRSRAWATSSGSPSVQVEDRAGSYGLEWVKPIMLAKVPS